MNHPHIKSELDLDNLSQRADLQEAIERDFGAATGDLKDGVSRRRWLQLMGASLALGGMAGCRYQEEEIVPFAFRPQNRVPGVPEKFASMIDFAGVAQPLLATCYDGRPTKLDGNPDHPLSRGASTAFTQARLLEMYDPERLRGPWERGEDGQQVETSWDALNDFATARLSAADLTGVAILTEQVGSPSLRRMLDRLVERGAKWYTWAAINQDNSREGCRRVFGKPYRMHYHFDKADVIVSLDADPLVMDPNGLGNSIGFASRRNPDEGEMSRLYAVESQFSQTGAAADHRISVRSSEMAGFVGALAAAIDSAGDSIDENLSYRDKVLACMAQDLVKSKGRGLIICGESQPPEVHAAVHALNARLGNIDQTITFTESSDIDRPNCISSIQEFAAQSRSIKTLVVLGGNPVYTAPRELDLEGVIGGIKDSLYVGHHRNETARVCRWVAAAAYPLEAWHDGWAYDGSICIGQPLIAPLFESPSELEMFARWMGDSVTDGLSIVRQTLGLSDAQWQRAVHDGFVAGSAARPVAVADQLADGIAMPAATDAWKTPWDGKKLEVVFNPSRSLWDGRFANNSWLQELPDFVTKVTWDNPLLVSPRTYEALQKAHGIRSQMIANIKVGDQVVGLPVLVQPGIADGSLGVEIGYGRTAGGRVAGDAEVRIDSIGFDVNPLRSIENWHFVEAGPPTGTSTVYRLAIVQEPWDIDPVGRNEIQDRMFRDKDKKEGDRSSLLREGTYESYKDFLLRHPIEHGHGDDHGDHDAHAADANRAPVVAGMLPIINNASWVSPVEAEDDHQHGGGGHDEHGHAHWPEAFHLHHENFDITPGAREDYKYDPNDPSQTNRWGMSIDLNRCIGCNACVMSCQAENNVPVVGKDQVMRGREMHWIRIDRYFGDNLYNDEAAESDDKQIIHQPVACHHCENAPCETVCPVAATTHSREGLNDMVYNRCIGTRYCGNNCPYKVRRFNYFNFTDAVTFLKYPGADRLEPGERAVQNLMMNPEVTIRSRGVMEKCSYCVQRIQNTKIQAKVEGRSIGANEITAACQDACPTRAIEFGDLSNTESRVRQAHDNPRAYFMLEELNVVPRTKYLARVRNVHPALIDHDDRDSIRGGRRREASTASAQ